jgi:hypothetical protein
MTDDGALILFRNWIISLLRSWWRCWWLKTWSLLRPFGSLSHSIKNLRPLCWCFGLSKKQLWCTCFDIFGFATILATFPKNWAYFFLIFWSHYFECTPKNISSAGPIKQQLWAAKPPITRVNELIAWGASLAQRKSEITIWKKTKRSRVQSPSLENFIKSIYSIHPWWGDYKPTAIMAPSLWLPVTFCWTPQFLLGSVDSKNNSSVNFFICNLWVGHLSKNFQMSVMFAGKDVAYLNRAPFNCSSPGLNCKH